MSILISARPISETKALIEQIHYRPDLLAANLTKKGVDVTKYISEKYIAVDNYTSPEQRPKKICYEFINPQTKETWAEYVDRPPNQEEVFAELLEKVNTMLAQQESIITKQDAIDTQLKLLSK